MQDITIAGQVFTIADITARFNDAQANPEAHGVHVASNIQNVLRNTITTFAHVVQMTPVTLAAKNKARNIMKLATVNALISSSLATYENAVKNSATKKGEDADKVASFKPAAANFTRQADCAALAISNKTGLPQLVYLTYPNPRGASKAYYIDADTNTVLAKDEVAELMRPADADKLLNPVTEQHNKTHDLKHNVGVRAPYLHNIVKVIANKQTVDNF
jgi:hypothetical protein